MSVSPGCYSSFLALLCLGLHGVKQLEISPGFLALTNLAEFPSSTFSAKLCVNSRTTSSTLLDAMSVVYLSRCVFTVDLSFYHPPRSGRRNELNAETSRLMLGKGLPVPGDCETYFVNFAARSQCWEKYI